MGRKLAQGTKEFVLPDLPPVWYDQEDINSCVGHAIAFCLSYFYYKKTQQAVMFSPMYVYWHARYIRGTIYRDDGSFLIDGVNSVVRWSACREKVWQHSHSNLTLQPSPEAYEDAMNFALTARYAVVRTVDEMKKALIHQLPVVLGFPVPEHFRRSLNGSEVFVMPPQPNERILGGHAIVVIGFSDYKDAFLCRNSWGRDWSIDGNFWLHYDYVNNGFVENAYALQVRRRRA